MEECGDNAVFTLEILTQESPFLELKSLDSTNLKVVVLVFTPEILTPKNHSLKLKFLDPTNLKETVLVFTPEILSPENHSLESNLQSSLEIFTLENPSPESKLPMFMLRLEILAPEIHYLGSRYQDPAMRRMPIAMFTPGILTLESHSLESKSPAPC
ncbi:hypothetical protein TIFTF001_016715 [Ficus carica]|uniref:Uncharacterized protein n=1 Tax=Ficus carica TaxID=3494 RepID=A0AA88DA35_FICCA|nr:hypothetical protein TIFTF001_016715 [Ficus carica]